MAETGIETKLDIGNQILGKLVNIIQAIFPRSIGTFTMAAATSKTVTDANVTAGSFVSLTATNAAAATLMAGANALYVSTASGSFVVATAGGGAAAGTETFAYSVTNPI